LDGGKLEIRNRALMIEHHSVLKEEDYKGRFFEKETLNVGI